MAMDDYTKALKAGQKYYRSMIGSGEYPYLHVLDEVIPGVNIVAENNLGLVEIPMSMIHGTKTVGRRNAFAGNFMPLLDTKTEFAAKWAILYDALAEEGLKDPIKAYEFMGRFFIQEGNKRVSVMRALGAVSIPGTVIRMVPERSDDKASRLYYEYLDFYKISGVNYLNFKNEGSYGKLIDLLPFSVTKWTKEDCSDFRSAFVKFEKAFEDCGGYKLNKVYPSDAMLRYLAIYDYATLREQSTEEVENALENIWKEIEALQPETERALQMQPTAGEKKGIITGMFGEGKVKQISAAFICDKTVKNSSWTYGHELGRRYLERVFPPRMLVTKFYENTSPENTAKRIDQAVLDGNNVIFTTTPVMLTATLKAAIEHPNVRFLNCSLNTNHPSIRTYYARTYEAKFLLGVIAGAMTQRGKIGYIAQTPIYGEMASINAFAIGVRMVNPHAKVHLEWNCVAGNDPEKNLREKGISLISGDDWVTPGSPQRTFGLYDLESGKPNIAMVMLDWGNLYEKIIRSMFDGSWKEEKKAINYWWGISTGVVDIICGSSVSQSVKQLVRFLRQGIAAGVVNPFSGILTSSEGQITSKEDSVLSPEEIIKIDWLLDNIVGRIPEYTELSQADQALMRLQGIEPLTDVKAKQKAAEKE